MQGRLLNGALTASDRYHVFALSHQTRGRGRYNLFPHARHAMPLWPDWARVHKQTSTVTGNPKCRPLSWTMTNDASPKTHADNRGDLPPKKASTLTLEGFDMTKACLEILKSRFIAGNTIVGRAVTGKQRSCHRKSRSRCWILGEMFANA